MRDEKLYRLTSTDFSGIQAIQKRSIQQLLDEKLFNKLRMTENAVGNKAYTLPEFLNDLYSGIFSEVFTGRPISTNRRFLQKTYVNELVSLIPMLSRTDGDAGSLLKAQAKMLLRNCAMRVNDRRNVLERAHLQDLVFRLDEVLNRQMRVINKSPKT